MSRRRILVADHDAAIREILVSPTFRSRSTIGMSTCWWCRRCLIAGDDCEGVHEVSRAQMASPKGRDEALGR